MTPRAALRIATATLALLIAPAAAQASTWTVDDDGAQCPNASFSSIQDAVDYAAPYDVILVCDGLYQESSTPTSGTHLPAQLGSRNGLTISKQLTIKGTGAGKVIIEPDPSLTTLAGTAPYLRDAGGNVISVTRASLGNGDDNEIIVDISGVTVRSGSVYAEAGVAYFNANGTISDSVIGPLKRPGAVVDASAPHGWGVIQTNFLQGGGPGSGTVRRMLTIEDSVVKGYVSGGILFDGGRGADGTPESLTSAGIIQFGYVRNTQVLGGGLYTGYPQTGVRYASGTRGKVTGTEITDNLYSSTVVGSESRSFGVFLADSLNSADRDQPGGDYPGVEYPGAGYPGAFGRGVTISGNFFARNQWALWNGTTGWSAATPTVRTGSPVLAPDNWWGCATGPRVGQATQFTVSSSTSIASYGCGGISGNDTGTPPAPTVEFAPFATMMPQELPAPSTADGAPAVAFTEVTELAEVPVGTAISPVVAAGDDFGVKSVELWIDGAPYATIASSPYEFRWTPLPAHAGKTVTLTAKATDSSGKSSTVSATVKVAAPPVEPTPTPTPTTPPVPTTPPTPPVATALPVIVGDVLVGETVACAAGSWSPAPTALSFQWLRAGAPIPGATGQTYTVVKADLASAITCAVTAGGTVATSPARTAAMTPTKTSRTSTLGVGPAIFTLSSPAVGSRSTGTTRIGGVECVATSCKVVVSGKITVGGRSAWFSRITLTTSGKSGLGIKVPATLRSRLRFSTGKAELRIAVTAGATTTSARTEIAIRLR